MARSSLERGHDEPRCNNGSPPCKMAPAPGLNPLRLCETCRDAYLVHGTGQVADECQACASPSGVIYLHVVGGMCFACGFTPSGILGTERYRALARQKMTRRLADLFRSGDRGPEWVALLARCPGDIRERIGMALAKSAAA